MNNSIRKFIAPVVSVFAVAAVAVAAAALLTPDATTPAVDCTEASGSIVIDGRIAHVYCETTTTAAPTTTTGVSTSTTAAATSTTASPTTSTSPPSTTSTTSSTTTTSTIAATTTTVPSASGCGLASAAFCETFDAPAGNGGRTGDLNPVLWGVSRLGDLNPGQFANGLPQTRNNRCSPNTPVYPDHDVRICNGQMVESINDGGGVVSLHTYPKQPFNFANRTGTVVFDVSADSGGTHAAWPEFVITDKPVPGMRRSISDQPPPRAANEVGFSLDGGCGTTATTGVGVVFFTVNGAYTQKQGARPSCISKGSPTAMNHFKVQVSTTKIDIYGTDAGSTTFRLLASETMPAGWTMTQGLVWLNDVHYNARKELEPCECGTQYDHSFTWDNLGFDGPKTYRDLGYDVPDALVLGGTNGNGEREMDLGYYVGTSNAKTFTLNNVTWQQTPTAAQVVLNVYSFDAANPTVSVNGNAPISTTWNSGGTCTAASPCVSQIFNPWTMSIPVPVSQINQGTNTIRVTSSSGSTIAMNISLILVAGAPVP